MRDTVYFEFHSNEDITGYVMSITYRDFKEIEKISQDVDGFRVRLTPTPDVDYKWGTIS